MLIRRKVFSVLEDETGEERLFSTSEVEYLDDYEGFADLRQREFARIDYEGLDEISKKELSDHRKQLAQELREKRNIINDNIKQGKYKVDPKKVSDKDVRKAMENLFIKNDYIKAMNEARNSSLDKRFELNMNQINREIKEDINKVNNEIKAKRASNIKNLKRVGKYGLGAAAIAGTAYGGKKLYDHYKK